MAPYRRAYMFTGEPSAAEDAADWLAALETNMYPSNTSRDKANLFSTRLFPKSPAKRWFNGLPDEVQRRWHLLKPEFESRWCTSVSPSLVAQISTVSVAIPIPVISPVPVPVPSTPIPIPLSPTSSSIAVLKPAPAPVTSDVPNLLQMPESEFDRLLMEAFQFGSKAGFKKGVADTTEKLKVKHEEDLQQAVTEIMERAQERCDGEYATAFELGRTSAAHDFREHQKSLQELQTNVGIQVNLPPDDDTFFTPITVEIPLPLTSEVGLQTSPSISLTLLPPPTPSLLLSPAPILLTSIPLTVPVPSSSPKLSWADDSASLPIIPLIKTPRDFSSLRSEKKPFSTLRHRTRRRNQTARRVSTSPIRFPSSNTNIPTSRRYPHLSPPVPHLNVAPVLPPALDWDRDPRLFELSRVLRSLGWSHSFSSRS